LGYPFSSPVEHGLIKIGLKGTYCLERSLKKRYDTHYHIDIFPYDSASDPRKTHALIGMILGIFGLASCFFYGAGILYCIPGLVLSIMGLKSTKNHGKAVAGLTTSIIGLALAGLAILVWTLIWLPFFVFF